MGDATTSTTTADDLGRDAFLTQVDGVLDAAYRLATVILLDYAAAEDAVHDATVRAWDRFRRSETRPVSFRTWFLAIVVAECRRVLWWRRLTFRGHEIGPVGGGPRDVLGGLPLASRLVLFCHISLDLPADEVARVVGGSPARVRSRIYRASERVQAQLQRDEEDDDG